MKIIIESPERLLLLMMTKVTLIIKMMINQQIYQSKTLTLYRMKVQVRKIVDIKTLVIQIKMMMMLVNHFSKINLILKNKTIK